MAVADGDPVVVVVGADGMPVVGAVGAPGDGDPVAIIIGSDGLPVAVASGAAPENPCDPDPEMLVTVTGVSGTINWCGKTWNLPADSGVQKSVCPTTYIKGRTAQDTGATTRSWHAQHKWAYGAGSLHLARTYALLGLYSTAWNYSLGTGNENNVWLLGTSARDRYLFYGSGSARPVAATFTTAVYSILGLVGGVAAPAYDDYSITDAFFGSHTIGGITYSWAKGLGWP